MSLLTKSEVDCMRRLVESVLKLFPEVKWDRWTGDIDHNQEVAAFGWIVREDGRSDFVFLRIDHDGPWMLTTSSAKHSAEFAERVGFKNHTDCKRVKDHFNI